MTTRTRTDALLLAGFCAFLFFYGMGQFGLIGADEPRYAQVAREMLQRHDWITPVLNGEPWLEKPPLYYWQAMIAYSIFGVSDWAARLPSAFDATLLVLAIYVFRRRLRSESASVGSAVDGALIAASSAGIIGYARAASMDMPLTAALTIAMLAWWAWRDRGNKIYLAAFYSFIALGMLAKGPVAPFLAAAVIILYAAVVREFRLILKTLWLPGIALFGVIALPWYLAVQVRNPDFFHAFIVEHNLGRFSTNLFHHPEPFWYYLPVSALALLPWTAFVMAAFIQEVRSFWASRKANGTRKSLPGDSFAIFACCWLILPVIFFSISQSKLPGYILPAIPAGSLLLAEYLGRYMKQNAAAPSAKGLVILHSVLAAAPIVPALLIAYLVSQHHLPSGRPLALALAIAIALWAGITLTLVRSTGLHLLRFVTLIPVVLAVGAVLKLGSAPIDQVLSARPVAQEIAAFQTHPLPLAVYQIRRDLEYGLTFYRNQLTFNYDWGKNGVPQQEHLLVAPENSQALVAKFVAGRRLFYLGHYPAQHLDFFWVAAAGAASAH
jgi:4-amino-4-deoxy-L-arabinose transferase-like glycosyltransferase